MEEPAKTSKIVVNQQTTSGPPQTTSTPGKPEKTLKKVIVIEKGKRPPLPSSVINNNSNKNTPTTNQNKNTSETTTTTTTTTTAMSSSSNPPPPISEKTQPIKITSTTASVNSKSPTKSNTGAETQRVESNDEILTQPLVQEEPLDEDQQTQQEQQDEQEQHQDNLVSMEHIVVHEDEIKEEEVEEIIPNVISQEIEMSDLSDKQPQNGGEGEEEEDLEIFDMEDTEEMITNNVILAAKKRHEELQQQQQQQQGGSTVMISNEYCLMCGQDLDEMIEVTEEELAASAKFEVSKYERFLSRSLLSNTLFDVDTVLSNNHDATYGRHNRQAIMDSSTSSNGDINSFCISCQSKIIQLYELHSNMENAMRRYEEERDKVAMKMVTTFLAHSKPPDDFPMDIHKESVAKKWKKIYTGEANKEKEVLKIIKEREHLAQSRAKRFQKLKGSLTSLRARNGVTDSKSAKQIQRTMTSIYFTPKPQVIRKRRQLYLKVAIPDSSQDSAFCCPACDKKFKHEYSLALHLRSHAVETGKLYKCSICDRVCSSRTQLMQHRKDDHLDEEKLIKCDACDETFNSRASFKAHIKTHVEVKTYKCDVCSKQFTSSYFLKKHVASHENVDFSVTDLFSCKKCSKTFLKSHDLNEHLKIHENPNLFGCDFCGKGFILEAEYKEHLTIHSGGNPYICEECGQRFSSEALLVSHLKIHRPKSHVCNQCGKACRSRDGLRKHQLIHTGKKPFSCHICSIGFIERKSFDAHMVKHTGKLPYKCNYCNSDEGFKDAKDLRKHKVIQHTEFLATDRKFTCDVCWNGFSTHEIMMEHKTKIHERYKCQHCNRVFKLGDHLRRHMYIHTGEKPYKCGMCDKSFNQESNLKEHMYRHTGIRPHQCPFCPGVGYLRKMHLKEHMVKEHGTDKVPSLPMGRAAQNARKSVTGIKSEPMTLESYAQQSSNCIILVQSKPNH